jgi:hypothetical protein
MEQESHVLLELFVPRRDLWIQHLALRDVLTDNWDGSNAQYVQKVIFVQDLDE